MRKRIKGLLSACWNILEMLLFGIREIRLKANKIKKNLEALLPAPLG